MKKQTIFLSSLVVFLGTLVASPVREIGFSPALPDPLAHLLINPVTAQGNPSALPLSSSQENNAGLLQQEDMPPEFRALPNPVARSIGDRLRVVTRFFGQENFQIDRYSAFVNPADLQIILGFTGSLPNQNDQLSFDSTMRQLQQPQFQQQLVNLLRRNLSELPQVNILDSQPLRNVNEVANSSAGVRMTVQFRNQVWLIDAVPFRRGGVGALAAVVYPRNVASPLPVSAVARRLDDRIIESSLLR
jgi:hypothetical protein